MSQRKSDLGIPLPYTWLNPSTRPKLGIYQFYQPEALSEPQKKAFSMLDISEQQVLMGILFEYTQKMGVDMQLVSLASRIPPQAPLRWLTPDEMLAWNIDNTHRHYFLIASVM